MEAMQMTPGMLEDFLAFTIPAGLPVLVTGAPGVGKTDITRAAAARCNADFIVTHPVVEDPTDRKGIPWPDAKTGTCQWFTDDVTKQLCTATKLTTWLIDDLGQASPATQATHMQWILNRGVNGHRLSDRVSIVACTNRRSDRAGVSGILEPVKSRFAAIVELVPDVDSWGRWAIANGISPMGIAFLRYRPELLSKFEATPDMTNSPMPRTWANLFKLETLNMPAAIEAAAFAGAVGEGASVEYLAFRHMARSLVNLDAILLNPDTVKLATKPDELYATCVGLAGRANVTSFPQIATYCERLEKAGKGEFAVLCIRDCVRRKPELQHEPTFARLYTGPIGKLIAGEVR